MWKTIKHKFKIWWKQLFCKHEGMKWTKRGDFHVHTCPVCSKQIIEREIR